MSTDITKLNHYDLRDLSMNPKLSEQEKQACQAEMVIRYIVNTSVECGKQELKRLITAWEQDNKIKEDAAALLVVIKECISRCDRKSLLTPLNTARKKLEAVA